MIRGVRWPWIVAPLLLLAAIAWLWWPQGADPATLDVTDPARDRTEPAAMTHDAAPVPAPVPGAAAHRTAATAEGITSLPTAEEFDRTAVFGVVVDEQKQPLAGAEVALFAHHARGIPEAAEPLATTVSDRSGRFAFPGRAQFTTFYLRAMADGFTRKARPAQAGCRLELELSRGCTLVGRVTRGAEKTPVPDLLLSLDPERGAVSQLCSVHTDSRGEFRLPPVPVGSNPQVWLRGTDGFLEERRAQPKAAGEQRFDLELESGPVLTLDTLDAQTQQPVAEAVLLDPWGREVARSDRSGRVTLRSGTRQRTGFHVEAPDYAPARWNARGDRPVEQPARLLLLRAVAVSGTVVTSDGAPVPDAVVTLEHLDQSRDATEEQTKAFEELAGAARKRLAHLIKDVRQVDEPALRTDAAGQFRFARVSHRSGFVRVRARVSAPGFCESVSAFGDAYLPGGRIELEVVLARSATLAGVVRADGEPARARVRMELPTGHGGRSIVTNDRGEYQLTDVTPGRCTVHANLEAMSFVGGSATVEVAAGATTQQDFDLERKFVTISGVLRGADGKPIANHTVWARREKKGPGPSQHTTRTAHDGTFRLAMQADVQGPFTVIASRPPAQARREQVAAGTADLVLVMPDVGRLQVAVVEAVASTVVPSYRLSWRSVGHDNWVQHRAADGEGRLKPAADGTVTVPVAAGVVELKVEAPWDGFLPVHLQRVTVAAGNDPTRVRVELRQGIEITVAVRGDKTLFGGPLFLVRPEDADRMRWPGEMPFGEEMLDHGMFPWAPDVPSWPITLRQPGEARVRPLQPGVYRIWCGNKKALPAPADITVTAEKGQRFQVELTRSVR